jgi:DNA-directed RNA polymerase
MSRQKHLEKSAYDVALERLQQQYEVLDSIGAANPALNRSTLQKWMWDWHQILRTRLEEELPAIAKRESKAPKAGKKYEPLTPYLTLVKAERLSLITILEIMRLQGSGGLSGGMKTTRALISVGKAVEMEYTAQLERKRPTKDIPQVSEGISSSLPYVPANAGGMRNFYSQIGYKNLQERRLAVAKRLKENEEWSASWSQATRSKIGGILVDCLMEVAEVERTAVCKKTGEEM